MPLMTITTPGVHEITSDYTASGPSDVGIAVAPGLHGVTIILKSKIVSPLFSTAMVNYGMTFNYTNGVTVIGAGGQFRGFTMGLRYHDCDGVRIRDLQIEDALMRGIKADGDDAFISGCLIKNIKGSTLTPKQFCMGIEVSGANPKIVGNTVQDVYGTVSGGDNGEGCGISLTDRATRAVVKGNTVQNLIKQPKSIGYWNGGTTNVSVTHNHVENFYYGFAGSSPTMGLLDENSTRDCDVNYVDSGGDWLIGGMDG